MRICPECGNTKIKEEGEVVCMGCGLVLRERDVVTQRIQDNFDLSDRSWEDPKTPVRRYDRWVSDQGDVAKKLSIPLSPETVAFLRQKKCKKCGRPASKKAKLFLCPEHAAEYRREYKKLHERKRRTKKD